MFNLYKLNNNSTVLFKYAFIYTCVEIYEYTLLWMRVCYVNLFMYTVVQSEKDVFFSAIKNAFFEKNKKMYFSVF